MKLEIISMPLTGHKNVTRGEFIKFFYVFDHSGHFT
jgi:hypothetical protein